MWLVFGFCCILIAHGIGICFRKSPWNEIQKQSHLIAEQLIKEMKTRVKK